MVEFIGNAGIFFESCDKAEARTELVAILQELKDQRVITGFVVRDVKATGN